MGITLEAESPQPEECLLQGSTIVLTCNVTGFPRPVITFMKGEESVTPGEGRVTSMSVDQVCKICITGMHIFLLAQWLKKGGIHIQQVMNGQESDQSRLGIMP